MIGSEGAYGRWLRRFFEARMQLRVLGLDPAAPQGDSLERLLAAYEPGQTVQVHAFRRDELHCFTLQLARPALDECVLSRQS